MSDIEVVLLWLVLWTALALLIYALAIMVPIELEEKEHNSKIFVHEPTALDLYFKFIEMDKKRKSIKEKIDKKVKEKINQEKKPNPSIYILAEKKE